MVVEVGVVEDGVEVVVFDVEVGVEGVVVEVVVVEVAVEDVVAVAGGDGVCGAIHGGIGQL